MTTEKFYGWFLLIMITAMFSVGYVFIKKIDSEVKREDISYVYQAQERK